MNLMQRRRALMVQAAAPEDPWEEITFDLTKFTDKTGNTITQVNGSSIRVYNTANGTYRCANMAFSTTQGYEYKITFDCTVTSGRAVLATRNSSNTMINRIPEGTSWDVGTYSNQFLVFEHNTNIAKIGLFCTMATSTKGDITYSNMKMYRRPL